MPVNNTATNTAPLSPYHQTPGTLAAGSNPFGSFPVGGPPAATHPTVGGLAHALKRRWVLATFLGVFVGAAAAAVTMLSMPSGKHVARTVLRVNHTTTGTEESFRIYKEELYQQLKSRAVVDLLMNKLNAPARLTMLQDVDDKPRYVEESIDARWVGDNILRVSMTGDNQEELKLLLESLVKSVSDTMESTDELQRNRRLKWVKDMQANLSRELEGLRQELKENAKGFAGVVPSADGSQSQLQTYQRIEADLRERVSGQELKLATFELQRKQLEETLEKPAPPVPADFTQRLIAKDARVLRAAEDLAHKQVALEEAKKTFAPTTQFYKTAEKAVADATKELADTKLRVLPDVEASAKEEYRKSLALDYNTLLNNVRQTETEKAATEGRLFTVSGQLQTMLARAVESQIIVEKTKPVNDLLTKIKEERVNLENPPSGDDRFKVIDPAMVYANQNLRQRVIAGSVAGLAGLAGVLLVIAFLEWRTRRIASVDQVINDLGLRVIGTIPAFPSKAAVKAGSVDANQSWRFILNESVNSTRTLLLHTAKAQSMQVIMVTSAMQGEGKTSLASQLATSMATAGLRTLILDCDMRNPSVHRLFDVALTPGCSEILCQEVDVADAVQATSVPNLWMIAGGQCSNRVVAALAQGQPIEALLNRLRGQFDFVVVDSCPVLPVADALLIGQHVDGVVFSILQDISQLPKVLDASKRLTSLNIPLLGAVVNGTRVDTYTYGYNYVKQLPA
jgi:polysaccharide biosynthesis transport protein